MIFHHAKSICPRGFFQGKEGELVCDTCKPNDLLCKTFPGALSTTAGTISQVKKLEQFHSNGLQDVNSSNNSFATRASARTVISDDNKHRFLSEWQFVIHLVLASFIAILLLTHRCWPISWRRLDLLFAGDHFIGDSHAKRMLDTRMGAAFTLSIPFVLGIFSVLTFGAINVRTAQSLIPESMLEIRLRELDNDKLFNRLNLSMETFSPFQNASCEVDIDFDASQAGHMKCKSEVVNPETAQLDTAGLCMIHTACDVGASISGTASLVFSLPEAFQNIRYVVRTDSWNGIDPDSIVESTIGASDSMLLAGGKTQPSMINFQLTRSMYQDKSRPSLLSFEERAKSDYYGIQLTALEKVPVESVTTTQTGKHFLSFNFKTTDSVFTLKREDMVSLDAQFSRLFTLLLSTLALFRFVKVYAELLTDNICLYWSSARGTPVPHDVRHRIRVLEEHHEGENLRMDHVEAEVGQGGVRVNASHRLTMLTSQENRKESEEVKVGHVELVSVENPTLTRSEASKSVNDKKLKELLKRVLWENEQMRKRITSLDEKVSRLASIVEGDLSQEPVIGTEVEKPMEKPSAKVSMPSGWRVLHTEDGCEYYCRPDGTTTWEPP